MKDLHLHALASHVVAWHNRHPLARRIGVEHLDSMGYVALPFVVSGAEPKHMAKQALGADAAEAATPGATLRERAMARAQQGAADAPPASTAQPVTPPVEQPVGPEQLRAAFTEDFMPRRSAAQVAQWVAQQGVALASEPTDAPVRKLKVHPGADATRLQQRWVLTAQVHGHGKRTRLLVGMTGTGATPAVLGQRLWSPVRVGLLVLALAGCAALVARWVSARPVAVAVAAPALPASASAASASASAPASALASASVSAPAGASSPVTPVAPVPPAAVAAVPPITTAAAPAAAHDQPIDVEPSLGRITLPSLGPGIEQRRLAASQAATAPTATAATTAVFAVATRPLRTRSEAEQVAAAMRALLVSADAPKLHVDILSVGDDWRVVGLPYNSPLAADKARAALAARGMKVQVVEF